MKSFKNIIIVGGLLLASTLSSLGASGNTGPVWSGGDFLGGNQSVFLTNSVTYIFNTNAGPGAGFPNIGFINPQGASVFAGTNMYLTNAGRYENFTGGYGTNANAYYGQAWYDVPSFSDANGNNASASIAIGLVGGATPYSTNTVTLGFAPLLVLSNSPNAEFLAYPSSITNSYVNISLYCSSNSAANSNVINNLVLTNLTTTQMQGVAGWRLMYVVMSTGGGTAYQYLNILRLNGYRP